MLLVNHVLTTTKCQWRHLRKSSLYFFFGHCLCKKLARKFRSIAAKLLVSLLTIPAILVQIQITKKIGNLAKTNIYK